MHTLFYFNDVSQLFDFDAFEVVPVDESHACACESPSQARFWAVIGTVTPEKAKNLSSTRFPIADLPSERYAELFVELCERITGKSKMTI